MSSVSDFLSFLSNGQAPQNVVTQGQTTQELPPWYNDYTQQILNKTAQYANEPYTPYAGPRVAPVNPMSDMAAQQTMAMNSPAPANYYSTAASMFGGGGDTSGAAGTTSAIGAPGTPGASGALSAAAPYNGIVGGGFPANVDKYMSPYTSNVVDEMARLSNRNLSENLIPALSDQFIRSGGGGYGLNTREGDMSVRLGRETAADLLGQQTNALESGYRDAANIYNQDFTNQQKGIGALNAYGTQYQTNQQQNLDTAYSDFLTQQKYPFTQAQNMASILPQIKTPEATTKYDYGPAQNYSASPLAQLGGLGFLYNSIMNPNGGKTGGTSGGSNNIASILALLGSGGATGGTTGSGSTDWASMLDPNYNWLTGGTTTGQPGLDALFRFKP